MFPSLQAAFDALPEEGGVVRISPGTFEISQPLLLSRGDVLIQGCGTATHIKNINTAGQPALMVRHPDGAKVKAEDKEASPVDGTFATVVRSVSCMGARAGR